MDGYYSTQVREAAQERRIKQLECVLARIALGFTNGDNADEVAISALGYPSTADLWAMVEEGGE